MTVKPFLDFAMERSNRTDMANATFVTDYHIRTVRRSSDQRQSPCGIRLTVVGPLSLNEMFIGERPTEPGHWVYDSTNLHLVTFNGHSKIVLAEGETAVSDIIEWKPQRSRGGIKVSFSIEGDVSPAVGAYDHAYSFFRPETDEATKEKRSAGYIAVPKSSFAVAGLEVMADAMEPA